MRRVVSFCSLIALMFVASAGAQQEEAIGRVKNVEGTAHLVRDGARTVIAPGDALFEGDVLETGPDSDLGILLGDDSRLSVGAETTFEIKDFHYRASEEGSLLTRLTKGTLLFVSGLIAKASPDSVQVETPVSTLAIRGTRFLVVVEDVP